MVKFELFIFLCCLAISLTEQTSDERLNLTRPVDDKDIDSKTMQAVEVELQQIYDLLNKLEYSGTARNGMMTSVLGPLQITMEDLLLKTGKSITFELSIRGRISRVGTSFGFTGRGSRRFVAFRFRGTGSTLRLRSASEGAPDRVSVARHVQHAHEAHVEDIVSFSGILENSLGETFTLKSTRITGSHGDLKVRLEGYSDDSGTMIKFEGVIETNDDESRFIITGNGEKSAFNPLLNWGK